MEGYLTAFVVVCALFVAWTCIERNFMRAARDRAAIRQEMKDHDRAVKAFVQKVIMDAVEEIKQTTKGV